MELKEKGIRQGGCDRGRNGAKMELIEKEAGTKQNWYRKRRGDREFMEKEEGPKKKIDRESATKKGIDRERDGA